MSFEDNKTLLGLLGILMCVYAVKLKLKRRKRRFKIRPINRARNSKGQYFYYKKMKSWDRPQFFKYTRMTVPVFEKLLDKIRFRITKQHRKDGISAEQRLIITLQYLSQGISMQALAWTFQVGHATVHKIVHETCREIWNALHNDYLKGPSSEEDWLRITSGFERRWHFPHCLGSLDGKHISIQAPAHSGSLFFNYKKFFSIVMLAVCDSKYRFTMVDIGAYGSQSDGGIFRNSIFGVKFKENDFHIPKSKLLNNTDIDMPYFLVADEAFPLKHYIMRPYAGKNLTKVQRIFNYRLSRARQVIENTFGILVTRWRVLKTTINAKAENVDNIIKAVTVLHNFCQIELGKENEENVYCPPGFVDSLDQEDGAWRLEESPLQSVGRLAGNRAKNCLYNVRDILANYLNSNQGGVSWQDKIINQV